MSERAQDVDTTRLEEELDESRRLIDDAKERAEELAEASPDPYHAEDREHEPEGGTRHQGVESPER